MKIIAVSDLHGYLPPIPECDLLIVAGDICPDFNQQCWFYDEIPRWTRPAGHVVMTWGNHDFCGEQFGFSDVPHIGRDRLYEVEHLKIWVSPWSPLFGDWAFMRTEEGLAERYAAIPDGLDILVSHCPPFGYGDMTQDGDRIGSHALLETIQRVRPAMVICGHIHEGYGQYDIDGIPCYNVSVVNERYQLAHPPTEITCL